MIIYTLDHEVWIATIFAKVKVLQRHETSQQKNCSHLLFRPVLISRTLYNDRLPSLTNFPPQCLCRVIKACMCLVRPGGSMKRDVIINYTTTPGQWRFHAWTGS